MCTCLSFVAGQHCFGRTLDLDVSYGEAVVITPRRFSLAFCRAGTLHGHYAIIGMAHVAEGIPLYYDAMNEHGLCMAGLNFPVSAHYRPEQQGVDNITPYELILWILSQCKTVQEARALLGHINIEDASFSDALPATPLHWMIADDCACIVVEAMADGLHVLDNPTRVLANNPPLPRQLETLARYSALTNATPANAQPVQGLGLGNAGLPGGYDSPARFVRAVLNSQWSARPGEADAVRAQFFQLMGTVSIPRGVVLTAKDAAHYTRYTGCCCTSTGMYCYTTPENSALTAVCLHHAELDGTALSVYPLLTDAHLCLQN